MLNSGTYYSMVQIQSCLKEGENMNSIHPIHYKIHLKPDLKNFKFTGTVELALEAVDAVHSIVLNILELVIWSCKVRMSDDWVACGFTVDPEKQELYLALPRKMSGPIVLMLEYEGLINDKMAGFYRSGFEQNDQLQYIGVTQFQENDARRAFPCMDHPMKKAVFDIVMDIDEDLVAISNENVIAEAKLDNGMKRVTFQQTPKMSTYLLFWGVGKFEFIKDSKDPRVRVAVLPGMLEYATFGLKFGRLALQFCERYFQIPYPLSKMDLIAVPDFAFGAMENWGAITFRENLLLHFPEITSKSGEVRICEVIAHEIAHQWFGNLVTPSDWKYLWLNESFATYFGYGVVDHHYPKWGVWDQFLIGQTDAALDRDGLQETFAIEIPGGGQVAINAGTAPIIYSKGGSILRQIEGYIGTENFRNGLRHYLEKHAYGNAASHHLWEAFEATAGMPSIHLIQSWIEQPGHPIVEVQRNKNMLYLTQKRFTFLPADSAQQWIVPVNILLFSADNQSKTVSILLDQKQASVNLNDNVIAFKVNAGQSGFYRVKYDDQGDLDALGPLVQEQQLSPEDRWGLQNDLFALVKRCDVSIDDYLDFLSYYRQEGSFLPLYSIAGNLFAAYLAYEGSARTKIASIGKEFIERTLGNIGYDPVPEEPPTHAILRDQILWHAILYGSGAVAEFAARKFRSMLAGERIHPDITKSIMQAGALNGQDDILKWFDRRLQSSHSEHERMNIQIALGCFKEWPLLEASLGYVLDRVPPRNRFIPIVSAAANPFAVENIWDWYLKNLDELQRFHPLLYERVIAAVVPLGGMKHATAVQGFFSRYVDEKPQIKDVVGLSLEKLKIHLQMRSA
jgi:aminopeptidase N